MRLYVLLPLCLGAAACYFQEKPPRIVEMRPEDPGLRSLFWMAGAWVTDGAEDRVEEQWSQPDGGTMMGVNRVLRGGETVFSEQLRIEKREHGIVYVAAPEGQEPTTFDLVQMTPAKVVFENLTHDFPNRITYWLSTDGGLHARIEATDGSNPRQWDWVLGER